MQHRVIKEVKKIKKSRHKRGQVHLYGDIVESKRKARRKDNRMKNHMSEINRQNLLLIYDIVQRFRQQSFFVGTSKLSQLLKNMNDVAEFLFSQKDCKAMAVELQQVLPPLLQAQSNQDYILQADILEGDMLPLLQKLQIWLQENTAVQLSDYLKENMTILEQTDRKLYMQLQENETNNRDLFYDKYETTLAINGQPTLHVRRGQYNFFMHSTVNPETEAKILVNEVSACEKYMVIGLGLGYHIMELLNRFPESQVIVLESEINLIKLSMKYQNWTKYLQSLQLEIVYNPDISELIKQTGYLQQPYELLVHYPTVQAVDDEKIRQLLEDFFMTISSMREQKIFLASNFSKLSKKHLPECGVLKPLFSKKNVVIVGAGPSVNGQIEMMKKYRNKVMIFATGHITKLLLKEGIRPDAVIITDPQPHMYKQIEGADTKNIPLILLSTASASVTNAYKGDIYVAYQNGYQPAEEMAESLNAETFETGGSVITTALDIALRFEAKKIIFVGVDLAYTDGSSHAKGVGRKITSREGLRKVKSCTGTEIYTSKNLDIYRKWIERRIENVTGTVIYNTGNGAIINGTQRMIWNKLDNDNILKKSG